jgi:hypothetical protein
MLVPEEDSSYSLVLIPSGGKELTTLVLFTISFLGSGFPQLE